MLKRLEEAKNNMRKFRTEREKIAAAMAGTDLTAARAQAADPATPAEQLDRLCAVEDAEVLAAIAANPNASRAALDYAGQRAPAAALANPLLELWSFMEPEWMLNMTKSWGYAVVEELHRREDVATLTKLFPRQYRLAIAEDGAGCDSLIMRLGYRDPDPQVRLKNAYKIGTVSARRAGEIRFSMAELEPWLALGQKKIDEDIAENWFGETGFHDHLYAIGRKKLLGTLVARPDCPANLLETALSSGNSYLVETVATNSNLTLDQQLRLRCHGGGLDRAAD